MVSEGVDLYLYLTIQTEISCLDLLCRNGDPLRKNLPRNSFTGLLLEVLHLFPSENSVIKSQNVFTASTPLFVTLSLLPRLT